MDMSNVNHQTTSKIKKRMEGAILVEGIALQYTEIKTTQISTAVSPENGADCALFDKSNKFLGKSTQGIKFIFRCAAIANLTFEG